MYSIKYTLLRKLAASWTLLRGVVFLSAPLLTRLDLISPIVRKSPSYAYINQWGEEVWGTFFVVAALLMLIPQNLFQRQRKILLRIGALCAIILWGVIGTIYLLTYPIGAHWLTSIYLAIFCVIIFLRPDDAPSIAARLTT